MMKLRNTITLTALAGVITIMPSIASAANPAFGSWTATNGINITGCPAGFTCEVINSGDGFQQANVTENADPSNVFVQTIITDVASGCSDFASCAFSDENFVKTDGISTGISGRQSTNDAALNFSSSVEINTGWALDVASPPSSVNINQGLTGDPTPGQPGDEFVTAFNLLVNLDSNGVQTGRSMNISQDVGLGVGSGDNQVFDVRQLSGTLQTNTGSSTLGATPVTVNWQSNDDVMVAWIGQDIDIGSIGSSVFAFQSVENFTAPRAGVTSDFSTTANDPTAAPFDWAVGSDVDATFGAAP